MLVSDVGKMTPKFKGFPSDLRMKIDNFVKLTVYNEIYPKKLSRRSL